MASETIDFGSVTVDDARRLAEEALHRPGSPREATIAAALIAALDTMRDDAASRIGSAANAKRRHVRVGLDRRHCNGCGAVPGQNHSPGCRGEMVLD